MDSKQDDQPLPLPLPATSDEEGEFRRNWSGLPQLALHSISRRLPSIRDFLSFSSVCTSWNSTSFTSTDLSTSFPPFLLLPVLPSQPPPTHFLLQTLTLENERRTFLSNIPLEILTLPCIGYTEGSLVFLSAHHNLLILADAFTGTLRRIVLPPGSPRPSIPLLSAAGTHLLLASDSAILSYRLQTDTWSQLDHGADSLAAVEDRVFCIDPDHDRIVVIESTTDAAGATTSIRSRPTEVSLPALPAFSTLCRSLGHRLVECGSDLLLLRVRLLISDVPDDGFFSHVLEVFRLDSETPTWTEVESLEDWCLFLDAMGSSVTACPDPARWGGKSNCVYITGPGCNSWVVVPLDGDRQFVFDDGDNNSSDTDQFVLDDPGGEFYNAGEAGVERIIELTRTLCDAMLQDFGPKQARWPSPVWVYPSRLHRHKASTGTSEVGGVGTKSAADSIVPGY